MSVGGIIFYSVIAVAALFGIVYVLGRACGDLVDRKPFRGWPDEDSK